MTETFDVAIIGGGISGVSLAARLAGSRRVVLLEAEEQLGTHATGRSAALLVEAYGPPEIRALTGMSRAFFETPPAGFADVPLARPRRGLVYAGTEGMGRLQHEFDLARQTTEVAWLDAAGVLEACPVLRPGTAAAGFLEPRALDLDANALLQGFARAAAREGVRFVRGAPVHSIERRDGGWRIGAGGWDCRCELIVNAAGAWADRIAVLAGVVPCGLQPMRRTAATIPVPSEVERLLPDLPFVTPADESFYFKPEARSLMVSLADETPSDPCDAFPEDIDVALALDRLHAATIVPPVRPAATWAGLRTFARDRRPVVGFDAAAEKFFWYAGQGGYGIQTAPALSALASALVLGAGLDERQASLIPALRPERLREPA